MATRVLWLTKGLGPGGTERLLVEMARARDRDRLEPTVAYVVPWKDHLAGELEAAGVATVCLSTRRRDLRWPLRLRRLVADGGFDVVHSHSPVLAVAGRLAATTVPGDRRPTLVTTEHNTWGSLRWATRWANRLTSRADVATFAVTEEVRASLRGAPAGRAEVLVHGVDVERIADVAGGDRMAVRTALGLRTDDALVGTVANLRAQKDYPTLLDAARLLVDRGVAFRLVAVGQGPLEREITSRRDELGLGDHVVLAGFRPDAVEVMAACDVFVLASAWEGLPVAVMEAAALGLPIVATRVGGIAEQFGPTDALLVPPRDPVALAGALESVLADPCRRAELASAARSAAPRFDIRRAIETITDSLRAARRRRARARPSPAPIRRHVDAIELRPATPDDREQILALLGVSLGWGDDTRYRELFAWKHERNPFGRSLAWVVERDGRVVAVRLFMRWMFRRGGSTLHAVRAVDTATHPDHQGHGLFTALTTHALEACRAEGVAFVFNTPNAQSRPGYLKMGWREVGRPAGRRAAHAARATSSRSPEAVSRPSSGQCHSTSVPTSRRGSTGAVAGRHRRRCRRPTGRCGRRRMTSSPAGGTAWPSCTTASSTIERRRSSCASDVAAPAWSSWSLTSSAIQTAPTVWWSTRSDEFARPTPCAWAVRTFAVGS